METILKEAARSFWKELGQSMVKKTMETIASELVRANVDLWKQARLQRQKHRISEELKDQKALKKKVRESVQAGEDDSDEES